MAAVWPSSLPQVPLRSGYSLQYSEGRVITDMDQGPRRIRSVFPNQPQQFTVQFLLTPAQLEAFNTFWNGDLANGAIAVALPVMSAGGFAPVDVQILKRGAPAFDGANRYTLALTVETV